MLPRTLDSQGQGLLRSACVLLALATAVSPGTAAASAEDSASVDPAHAEAIEQARTRVHAWLTRNDVPGVSVAVGLDGEIVWAEGFGFADLEQQVPVTPMTRFRAGSVAKPLTSAGVGLLYQRDLIDLDAPVQTYVPSFPAKRWPVSTRQLMGHVAGVRHYSSDQEFLSAKHYDGVLEALEIFAADSLLFRPGSQYTYSSYGWNLVSAVVETAAGKPFLEFMEVDVFSPLEMSSTIPDDVFALVPDRARFYDRNADGQLRNADFVDASNKWASGGFLSTPSDLVRFGIAMLEARLLERGTLDVLWTPVQLDSGEPTGEGLGWSIKKPGGELVIGQGGGSVGGKASLLIFRERRMVVSVMSNVSDAPIGPVTMGMGRLFSQARQR